MKRAPSFHGLVGRKRGRQLMRYVAISLATLALIAGATAVAFVYLGRSLNELSPQSRRLWEQGWTGAARRLVVAAAGLLLVAVLLFASSFA